MVNETDRIVVVSNGFGVWVDGRHAASARWGDVSRIVARGPDDAAGATPGLVVTLANGTDIALSPATPGWVAFLTAASARLTGLRTPDPALVRGRLTIFERAPGR